MPFKKLLELESRFISFVQRNIVYIYFIIACLFVLFVRDNLLYYKSGDYIFFLKPWFNEIKENGGFASLGQSIGDYNMPYMYLLTMLTYIPIDAHYTIKYLSIIFDILQGFSCALIVYQMSGRDKKARNRAMFTFIMVLMIPTVILNSAAWGQCDSIYTSFLILSLYSILRDRPKTSMLFFSIALSFKLQAIFMMPLFLILCFTNKKISLRHFLIIPVVNFIAIIPALIAGRSLSDILNIYSNQMEEYEGLTMNYANIYALVTNDSLVLSRMGIVLTVFIFGTVAAYIIRKKYVLSDSVTILLMIWGIMTCVMFLPHMHDRYGYALEVLCVVYYIMIKRNLLIPTLIVLVSLVAYINYLFMNPNMMSLESFALINMAAYFVVFWDLMKELEISNKKTVNISEGASVDKASD